jgi:hypothetical protein
MGDESIMAPKAHGTSHVRMHLHFCFISLRFEIVGNIAACL